MEENLFHKKRKKNHEIILFHVAIQSFLNNIQILRIKFTFFGRILSLFENTSEIETLLSREMSEFQEQSEISTIKTKIL